MMDAPNDVLTIEASLFFARKVACRYEQQNRLDDSNYAQVIQLIGELERRLEALTGHMAEEPMPNWQ